MSFYERYAQCCADKGIAPVSQSAADAIGCTKGTISCYAKRETTPRGEIVAGMARMLDVSADYLLGIIDTPHPLEVEGKFSKNEMAVLAMLKELNEEGVEVVINLVRGLVSQDLYKKYYQSEMVEKQA